jgi:AsmA family/AsmA-like C-terminal region
MGNIKKRILWIAGGVALAIIVLIIIVLSFGVKTLKPQIEASASKAMGMDVRIRGGMNVSLFPVLGASLGDISATQRGAEVIGMAHLRIGLKLVPLIRGRVDITQLQLVSPVLSIVRQRDGKLNIDALFAGSSSGPVTVKKLSVSQGTIRYADLQSGEKVELDGISLAAADLHAGGAAGANPMKNLSFSGNVRCRAIKAGSLTLTDLAADAAAGKGVFDVSRARVKLFGGTGSGTLQADFSRPEPRFQFALSLREFKIQDVLQESGGAKRMEGPADFSADLAASGKTGSELMRTLGGRASVTAENIQLDGVDIDGMLGSLDQSQVNLADIGGFLLASPLGATLSKGYKLAGLLPASPGGRSTITRLVSVWKVERGTAEAADVAMATQKNRIAIKGGLNFVNERFENIVMAVLDDRGCAAFSQKIQGPFAHPQMDKISTLESFAGPLASLFGKGKNRTLAELGQLAAPRPCSVPFYSGSVAPPANSGRPNR